MEIDGVMHALNMMCQVFLLDLVLSGDNAVVIGLACQFLPQQQKRKVVLLGTIAAIVLRVVLTLIITYLLRIPSLKLIGGAALIWIALKLTTEHSSSSQSTANKLAKGNANTNNLWSVVGIVIVADVVMSMDNVVALAAAVQGNLLLLTFGLMLSIPLLMYGSLFVSGLINRFAVLVPVVGALLGWIAGDIACSDPLIAEWINTQSPALTFVIPLLCAVYVVYQYTLGTPINAFAASESIGLAAEIHPSGAITSTEQRAHPDHQSNSINNAVITQASSLDVEVEVEAETDAEQTKEQAIQSFLSDFIQLIQRHKLRTLSVLIVFLTVAALVSLFTKSVLPAPSNLARYECPGYNGSFALYYQPGNPQVQLRFGRHVFDGNQQNGKIEWPLDAAKSLGFVPPFEIISDNSKTLQINGGNFVKISCLATP